MSTRKLVYYMRHFEALHNLPPPNYRIPDPELTPQAQQQALTAIEVVKQIPAIDLIVCSPLIRTLQTYLLVFNNQNRCPLIIHPDLQEIFCEPSDIGSSVEELRKRFPSLINELNTFTQTFGENEWLEKTNPENIYSPERLEERKKRLLNWILNRPEKNIFIISHNVMLKAFLYNDRDHKYDFQNGEIRQIQY